ncbi:MAG TPA: SulP family inorganic anion transporter, partial [Rhodospirillales bacterium]
MSGKFASPISARGRQRISHGDRPTPYWGGPMQFVHGLHFNNLKGDIYGGITSGVVALPLALAFGVASGAGPMAGIYGAIFVGFFAALFGG